MSAVNLPPLPHLYEKPPPKNKSPEDTNHGRAAAVQSAMLKRPKFAAQTLPLLFPNLANIPRTQKFMSLPAHLFSPPIPREQGLEAAVVAACAMNPPRAFWHVPCRGKLLLQGCRMARLHFGARIPTLFVLGLQAPAIILSARHHPLKTVPFLHSSIIPCSSSGPTRGPALPGRTLRRQEKKKPKNQNKTMKKHN